MRRIYRSLLLLCLALGVLACAQPTAREKVLAERARWEVLLLDWVQSAEDQRVTVSTRITGPPSGELQKLSVEFLLLDAAGDPVGSHWHTYDLSEIQRGAPTDLTVRIPADQPIEGLGVVAPSLGLSEGDDAFLEELRGLPAE